MTLTNQIISDYLDQAAESRDLQLGADMILKLTGNRYLYARLTKNLPQHADYIEQRLRALLNLRIAQITHQEVEQMAKEAERIAAQRNLDRPRLEPQTTSPAALPNLPGVSGISGASEGYAGVPACGQAPTKFSGASGTSSASSSEIHEIKNGKRPDHDSLPPEIQQLYYDQPRILQRMRSVHEHLKTISNPANAKLYCQDSDRYPYLKELLDLDATYRKNWQLYDDYQP